MATEAEQKKKRHDAGIKGAETRRANRIAAENRAKEQKTNSSRNLGWLPWVLLGLFILGMLLWHPWTVPTAPTATETPVVSSTEVPIVVATEAPKATEVVTTEVPVVATEAPVVETPIVACETIEVSKDNGVTWENAGLSLETESVYDIGKRVTFTNRSVLVPNKAYNEELSDLELQTVENTWLDVRFNACDTEAVVFSHGFEMNNTIFNGGVLFNLKGEQQIRIRNGEVVLWYDIPHRDKDLGRIIDQIKVGNFDIHGPLALAVADRLKDVKVVADYLATRPDIRIVILP